MFTGLVRVHTVTKVQVLSTAELFWLYSSTGKTKRSSFKMVLRVKSVSTSDRLIQAKNIKVWIHFENFISSQILLTIFFFLLYGKK